MGEISPPINKGTQECGLHRRICGFTRRYLGTQSKTKMHDRHTRRGDFSKSAGSSVYNRSQKSMDGSFKQMDEITQRFLMTFIIGFKVIWFDMRVEYIV